MIGRRSSSAHPTCRGHGVPNGIGPLHMYSDDTAPDPALAFVHVGLSLVGYALVAALWLIPDRRIEHHLSHGA